MAALQGTLAEDCLFCKIIEQKIPSVKIYEDDLTYAFMDIMPQADGHVLTIPKHHAEDVHALPAEWARACMETAQKIANATKQALGCPGLMMMQLNGAAAGQTVFHYHIHTIPRFDGLDLKLHARDMVDAASLQPIADKIIAAL